MKNIATKQSHTLQKINPTQGSESYPWIEKAKGFLVFSLAWWSFTAALAQKLSVSP